MTQRLVIQASASSGSNVDTAPQRRRAGFFKARMALSNLEEYVVSEKMKKLWENLWENHENLGFIFLSLLIPWKIYGVISRPHHIPLCKTCKNKITVLSGSSYHVYVTGPWTSTRLYRIFEAPLQQRRAPRQPWNLSKPRLEWLYRIVYRYLTARAVLLDCWHPIFTCSSGKTWMEATHGQHDQPSIWGSLILVPYGLAAGSQVIKKPLGIGRLQCYPVFWLNFVCSRTASCSLTAFFFHALICANGTAGQGATVRKAACSVLALVDSHKPVQRWQHAKMQGFIVFDYLYARFLQVDLRV